MVRRSPTEAFQMDVMEEMLPEFQEQAERCSCRKNSGMRICDLISELPSGQDRLVDHL
jgi:hypothetical protein